MTSNMLSALTDPTATIQALYNATTAKTFPDAVEAHFKQVFSSNDAFMKVRAQFSNKF